jgi:hypothetical protein
MNIEEIEITSNSLAKFLDDECSDEDDYGIPMIIFYADINNKCGKFQVICNGLYRKLNTTRKEKNFFRRYKNFYS